VPYIIIIYTLKYTYYIIGTVILNILYTIIYDIYIYVNINIHTDSTIQTPSPSKSHWEVPAPTDKCLGKSHAWGSCSDGDRFLASPR
jgi:hypothetical protein